MIFWVKHLRRNSMINNDWERFGDEIRRTIQDAVDNQDFRRLNQTVSDTIGRAMDAVSTGMKNGGWYRDPNAGGNGADFGQHGGNAQGRQREADTGQWNGNEAAGFGTGMVQPRKKMLYLKATAPKVGGTFMAITGYGFGVASLIFLGLLCVGAAELG